MFIGRTFRRMFRRNSQTHNRLRELSRKVKARSGTAGRASSGTVARLREFTDAEDEHAEESQGERRWLGHLRIFVGMPRQIQSSQRKSFGAGQFAI